MDEQAHYACARARISTYGALGVWIDQLGRALPSQVLARREKEFGIVTNDLFVYESARQAQAFLVLARSFCEARRAGMDFTQARDIYFQAMEKLGMPPAQEHHLTYQGIPEDDIHDGADDKETERIFHCRYVAEFCTLIRHTREHMREFEQGLGVAAPYLFGQIATLQKNALIGGKSIEETMPVLADTADRRLVAQARAWLDLRFRIIDKRATLMQVFGHKGGWDEQSMRQFFSLQCEKDHIVNLGLFIDVLEERDGLLWPFLAAAVDDAKAMGLTDEEKTDPLHVFSFDRCGALRIIGECWHAGDIEAGREDGKSLVALSGDPALQDIEDAARDRLIAALFQVFPADSQSVQAQAEEQAKAGPLGAALAVLRPE